MISRFAGACPQEALPEVDRKDWAQKRLGTLACISGVDVTGFAVMSNHLHVILRR